MLFLKILRQKSCTINYLTHLQAATKFGPQLNLKKKWQFTKRKIDFFLVYIMLKGTIRASVEKAIAVQKLLEHRNAKKVQSFPERVVCHIY